MKTTTLVEAIRVHLRNKTSVTKSPRGAAATKNFTAPIELCKAPAGIVSLVTPRAQGAG
jgi:hypothetical protein